MDQDEINFYVYEFASNRYVRIHEGSCGHCKEGKGRSKIADANGKWYGPYTTFKAAQAFAKTLNRKNTNACGTCLAGRVFKTEVSS